MKPRSQSARCVLSAVVLFSLVLVAGNWRQQIATSTATDGVLWRESAVGLVASSVSPESPGARAGIQPGDILFQLGTADQTTAVHSLKDHTAYLLGQLPGNEVALTVIREGEPMPLRLTLGEQNAGSPLPALLGAVGLFYLALGAWVLWQRLRNPRAPLFVLYCLSSFLLFGLSYTGRFDTLDWIAYWLDSLAILLQPALFAHLCLTYWQSGIPRPGRNGEATRSEEHTLNSSH